MAECSECARLTQDLRRVEATLTVRTYNYGYPLRPEKFRHNGAASAYDAGYEAAWRNRQFRNAYTRPDCVDAYSAGYRQGERDSLEEIGRAMDPSWNGKIKPRE